MSSGHTPNPRFVLKCKNGHEVVTAIEAKAQRLSGTACELCYKPLLVREVRAG